ncbi:hypothetical protein [Anaerostipes sp.]|uniref:hypothetical protein n=1 Tax=Anaerostipes sp. TaxID=1872530 RepID=UPI0025C6FC6B|nr:hypothetical protein [Anaerostipes sp.]MBS7009849.1 hypothetical protein [Anaerostipes sp.]
MQFIQILLSSVVLVAVIEYILKNKSNSLQYITSARSDWRKDMKQTASRLYQADRGQIGEIFAELKVNLNGYGFFPTLDLYPDDKQLEFFRDEHIWKQIAYIEEKMNDWEDETFSREKNKVNEYITCLLKFDWERTKQEVKTKSTVLLFIVLFFCVHIPVLHFLQGDKNVVSHIWDQLIPISCIVLSMVSVYLPNVVNESKMLQFGKWYKYETFNFLTWAIGGCLELAGLYILAHRPGAFDDILYYLTGGAAVAILAGIMFHAFGYKLIYLKYDRAVRRTMGCDSVICYSSQTGLAYNCTSFLIHDFFARLNVDFSDRELPEHSGEILEFICRPDSSVLDKPEHLLRHRSRIRYAVSRKKDIKAFIIDKPKRCRFIFKFTSGFEEYFTVGYNKKTKMKFQEWIYKDSSRVNP